MTTRFFQWTMPEPSLLLRKTDNAEQIFINGRWKDTELVGQYLYGLNDFVEDMTEAEAKRQFPLAFE